MIVGLLSAGASSISRPRARARSAWTALLTSPSKWSAARADTEAQGFDYRSAKREASASRFHVGCRRGHIQANIISQHSARAPSAIPPMPPADSVPEFETRRTFYKIDNRVCAILAAVWPIIAPTIDRSINEVIDGVLELPIGERVVAAS